MSDEFTPFSGLQCALNDGENAVIKINFSTYQKANSISSYSSIALKFRVTVPRSANYSIALLYTVRVP